MVNTSGTVNFYNNDFMRTLFPLKTGKILIETGSAEIFAYIGDCISTNSNLNRTFLPQTRAYAAKVGNHLRRTVKLDPVAELFLYDLSYRNRSKFRAPFKDHKKHFGYRFENGEPISATDSYSGFKGAISDYRSLYQHNLSFDVASFFNSIYHHDLVSWMATIGADEQDYHAFGKFLRETNSGRSIDCLPQGIYPAKMIGNDFLRYIEQYSSLRSPAILRFMDDFVLFSDNEDHLWEDFYTIQKLLGDKGLSVNPTKTKFGAQSHVDMENNVSEVKAKLLKKRRFLMTTYTDDGGEEITEMHSEEELSPEEIGFVRELLSASHIEEEDAELILSIFKDYPNEVMPHLPTIATRYPHLAKNIWSFCRHVDDDEFIEYLCSQLLDLQSTQEYQLFWIGQILEDYLLDSPSAPNIIDQAMNHKNASYISKAKILEIPDSRYGLTEMRDSHLGAGRSDWLAWASAVGHRHLPAISRNHKLSYFANSSSMNNLIHSILQKV
ncbi:antiviral reverse transcriptase Drt5 [Rubrimonas cliftonensis]|uniref:Reverse transcriptase (RNA-dependent DNA polymerase) n=1 Tax=Rubrimonas cliftonensis TaxID=89524 RepID=A0A1H4EX98_9RHOB|nr:antiviral reverse transcriptase Drt5 [Rubrimonas cliftonensis]SEA89208.1 Reverse transcriptase (RNA-dependent DNA polymerase) [Rubrimonas cliftonensis]